MINYDELLAAPKPQAKVSDTPKKPTLADAISALELQVMQTAVFFETLSTENIVHLLKCFQLLTENKNALDDLCKIIDGVHAKLSSETIPAIMESQDVKSMNVNGKNFILNSRMFASIPEELKEKGFAWLKEHGLEALIKPTVNSQSLTSAVKEMIESDAITPPDDAIKLHTKQYISIRKA